MVDLDTNIVSYGERIMRLPGMEAVALSKLIEKFPAAVTDEQFALAFYGYSSDAPLNINRIVTVYMHHLRHKLKGVPFRVENVWGVGYRLVRDKSNV